MLHPGRRAANGFKSPVIALRQHSSLLCDEADEVGALLVLLDAREHHLRPWHVFLGVDQILEHVLVRPDDRRIFVGLRVGETLASARGAAHDAPKGRALLGIAALLYGVALCALR